MDAAKPMETGMRRQFAVKSRGLFDPKSDKPFKISRSTIELFLECPRCFYPNYRLGIRRPSGPPFTINSLVDRLLKKELDFHRVTGSAHSIDAKIWRGGSAVSASEN